MLSRAGIRDSISTLQPDPAERILWMIVPVSLQAGMCVPVTIFFYNN